MLLITSDPPRRFPGQLLCAAVRLKQWQLGALWCFGQLRALLSRGLGNWLCVRNAACRAGFCKVANYSSWHSQTTGFQVCAVIVSLRGKSEFAEKMKENEVESRVRDEKAFCNLTSCALVVSFWSATADDCCLSDCPGGWCLGPLILMSQLTVLWYMWCKCFE